MKKDDVIYVTGHRGMVGSGLLGYFKDGGYTNVVTANRSEVDLRNQQQVDDFIKVNKPDYVFLSAAKVGGIQANINSPAEFLYDNLCIQNNVINSSFRAGVKKLIYLGSSCIYPRDCPQPMKEDYMLTGPLEPTNEGYAIAKIAGLKMLEAYKHQYGFDSLNLMPCNLYGTNDHYDPTNSHVLTALVKRFVDAVDDGVKEVVMWGNGSSRREFMHISDFIKAVFFLIEKWPTSEMINVGTGQDVSIRELAELIAEKTNYKGTMVWDTSKPDGMPRKCLDISKLERLGFKSTVSLEAGIERTIAEYKTLKQLTI